MATSQQPAAPAGQRAGSNQQADAERPARRLASSPAVGFIPWILFWVIGGPSTWETATIAALVAAILLMGLSLDLGSRRRPARRNDS